MDAGWLSINRRGMHTAEYAICFGLVIAAVVGMQTYVKRGLQARMKTGADMVVKVTNKSVTIGSGDSAKILPMGGLSQYEPYYELSSQDSERASFTEEGHTDGIAGINRTEQSRQIRKAGGVQTEQGAMDTTAIDQGWANSNLAPTPPPPK